MSAKKPPRGQPSPGNDILAGLDTAKARLKCHVAPKDTDPTAHETLPALLPRRELRPMIKDARKYARNAKRNGLLLAIELRRLQDARAHLTYGRKSFADWAADEFADLDLTKDTIKKLTLAGRSLIVLIEHGRVDLQRPSTLPGVTGARALTSVLANHDEQAMLRVFDNTPPERIVGATVKQTIAAVLPPAQPTAEPEPPAREDDQDEENEKPEDLPKEVQELRDRVERLRDLLDDLTLADDADPITIKRQYEHFLEDAQALKPALDAVLPTEPAAGSDITWERITAGDIQVGDRVARARGLGFFHVSGLAGGPVSVTLLDENGRILARPHRTAKWWRIAG
jgi:hypothetical protein